MTARSRLDAIRARVESATEGRWVYGGQGWVFAQSVSIGDDELRDLLAQVRTNDADAEFIAASRSDVPDLVAFARAVLDLAKEHRAIESKDPWAEVPAGIVAYAIERLADEHLTTKGDDRG